MPISERTRRIVQCVAVLFVCIAAAVPFMAFRGKPEMSIWPENRFAKTLVLAGDLDFEPYSFLDAEGRPSGHDIEFVHLLANRLGVNVDIRLSTWHEAREALRTGEVDLLMSLELRPENLPDLLMSMPIVDEPFVAFGHKKLDNFNGLYGARIGTLENSGAYPYFLRPHRLDKQVTTYRTYSEAFDALRNGREDFVVVRHSVGRSIVARLGTSSIRAVGPRLVSSFLAFAAREDRADLIAEIDAEILRMKRDGSLEALQRKWLGTYIDVINLEDFVMANLPVILALLGLFALMALGLYVSFNRQMIRAVEHERQELLKSLEYQRLLTEAATDFYDYNHEIDLTHNVAGNEPTRDFLRSMGLSPDTPYDEASAQMALRVTKAFREEFLELFRRDKLLTAYANGMLTSKSEFPYRQSERQPPVWMRVTVRLFHWAADDSVRMISCWQNIDEAKKHERTLLERAQRDSLTGLYNKKATSELVTTWLSQPLEPGRRHALFILDIDQFKNVNDQMGHMFGDQVIMIFSAQIRRQFREADVVGRVGGDEFMVFSPGIRNEEWVRQKAARLVESLSRDVTIDGKTCHISASIGVAICPTGGRDFETLYKHADACLYATKQRGRNGYTLFVDSQKTPPPAECTP